MFKAYGPTLGRRLGRGHRYNKVMPAISEEFLEMLVASADHSHVKIQMTDGVPTWEAMPGFKHQRIVQSTFLSVRRMPNSENDCGCHRFLDVMIRFPDGSFRSPDIAIYCQEPPDVDGAGDVIPVAVIEIVSQHYELKDQIGLPFYLSQGIADVVLYDPRTGEVIHATPQGQTTHTAPAELEFACGCAVTIPL